MSSPFYVGKPPNSRSKAVLERLPSCRSKRRPPNIASESTESMSTSARRSRCETLSDKSVPQLCKRASRYRCMRRLPMPSLNRVAHPLNGCGVPRKVLVVLMDAWQAALSSGVPPRETAVTWTALRSAGMTRQQFATMLGDHWLAADEIQAGPSRREQPRRDRPRAHTRVWLVRHGYGQLLKGGLDRADSNMQVRAAASLGREGPRAMVVRAVDQAIPPRR